MDPRQCIKCYQYVRTDRTSVNVHNKSCAHKMKAFYKQHVKRTLICPEVGCGAKIAPKGISHQYQCKAIKIIGKTRNQSSKEDQKCSPLKIPRTQQTPSYQNQLYGALLSNQGDIISSAPSGYQKNVQQESLTKVRNHRMESSVSSN